jgi:hypothetical protein
VVFHDSGTGVASAETSMLISFTTLMSSSIVLIFISEIECYKFLDEQFDYFGCCQNCFVKVWIGDVAKFQFKKYLCACAHEPIQIPIELAARCAPCMRGFCRDKACMHRAK